MIPLCFSRQFHLWSLLSGVALFTSCQTPAEKLANDPEHTQFNRLVQRAFTDFSQLHQNDTLDFRMFNSFAWDSLYVFPSDTYVREVQDDWGWINWKPVWDIGLRVPEHHNRFVFVHGHQAVNYIDISTRLVRSVHYRKYVKDERGVLVTYVDTPKGVHYLPVNCFSKAEACFILVCSVDVPKNNSTEHVYAPAAFFIGKQAVLQKSIDEVALSMHPISDCGYPNCWANMPHQ